MVNYQNGKIYKIISSFSNMIYVGSTTKKYLSDRMYHHNVDLRKWLRNQGNYSSSFSILLFGDVRIILLENCPCNSKAELNAREQFYIDYFRESCVNLNNAAGINKQKQIASQKRFRVRNHEKLKAKDRQFKKKHYHENNVYREKIKTNSKDYYAKNKTKINERRKIKYTCPCGSILRTSDKSQHEKTIKHQLWLESYII